MRLRCGWIALFLFGFLASLRGASADALALQQRLIEVFQQNRDAIVRVKAAYRESASDDEGKVQVVLRVGTGFFVSREGHVLVSASRAAGADRVWVEFKGESYATEPLGHDRLTNISLLRVLDPPETFSIISVDPSVARPALASIAVAIYVTGQGGKLAREQRIAAIARALYDGFAVRAQQNPTRNWASAPYATGG